MLPCVQKKLPSNTATEIIFNDRVKAHIEVEKDFKIYLGNAKYIFVLKPIINGLWSLTTWVQSLGVPLITCVTLSKLVNCAVPQFPYLEDGIINNFFLLASYENYTPCVY